VEIGRLAKLQRVPNAWEAKHKQMDNLQLCPNAGAVANIDSTNKET
jgi:hypothetical protein